MSSFYSRLHFRHYITAADSKTLSKLHASKISEVFRKHILQILESTKHTRYCNLWEVCHRLDVKLEVDGKHHIKPV